MFIKLEHCFIPIYEPSGDAKPEIQSITGLKMYLCSNVGEQHSSEGSHIVQQCQSYTCTSTSQQLFNKLILLQIYP
jgi:hypothetical protein